MPPTGAATPSACISAWLAPACHSGHVSCPPSHALLKKLDTFSSDLLYCINSILVITCITWYFLACLSVSAQEKEGPGLCDTWTRPQRPEAHRPTATPSPNCLTTGSDRAPPTPLRGSRGTGSGARARSPPPTADPVPLCSSLSQGTRGREEKALAPCRRSATVRWQPKAPRRSPPGLSIFV